jgi:parvulin-like peptidyl-prolyl isomerase
MKKTFAVPALLLLAAVTMLAQGHPVAAKQTNGSPIAAPTGKVIAKVNGAPLTDRDLLRQMMIEFPYAKQHGGKFPAEFEKDIRRNALNEIEFEELAYQEAQRRHLTVAPAKLDAALRDFKKQFATTSDFTNYLYAEHQGSMDLLKAKIKRAILIEQVLQSEIGVKSKVTPAQLLDAYKKNPGRFTKPESVTLQTISFVIPDNATAQSKAQVRQKAEQVLKQAQAAKDYNEFGLLAEKNSEDDWRVLMGDHKSVHRGRMPPPVEAIVFKMKPGTVSGLIETENSYCIARVNATQASRLMPFREVKPQLKKELESQRATQLRQDLEARLRKNAKVEEF